MSLEKRIELEIGPEARLWLKQETGRTPVQVKLCFPWTDRIQHVALLDGKGAEIAMIANPALLGPASRAALEFALLESKFVFEIQTIDSIEEEVELRVWKVRTLQGYRTFQTKLDEYPRKVPGGGFLIRDVSGDLFLLRDLGKLDRASWKKVWPYVD